MNNMASKESRNKKNRIQLNMDAISKGILTLIDSSISDSQNLSKRDAKFQEIINRELELSKGVANGSIVDFVTNLRSSNMVGKNNTPLGTPQVDTDSLFTKDISDIFGYFQDLYKNKYIEMSDLKFISKFIPDLGEAVKITLESIISADNICDGTISRKIEVPASINKEDYDIIMRVIESIEDELHLNRKLKEIVFKKTLITGKFYVYAVSYKKIFGEFERLRAGGKINADGICSIDNQTARQFTKKMTEKTRFNIKNQKANESEESTLFAKVVSVLESDLALKDDIKNLKILKENLSSVIPSIEVLPTCPVLYDALESAIELDRYQEVFGEFLETRQDDTESTEPVADGTYSPEDRAKFEKKFKDVSGTYIKYIDPKNLIPIEIFERVIGYYYLHPVAKNRKTSAASNGVNGILSMNGALFSNTDLTEQKKEQAINNIVNVISEGIISQFSPSFVNNNPEFKQLIADCIIANGMVDNDYKIQFIPAEDIIEFKINEDENGNGESILANSLFPAKLLLSLMICKMLNYMNKSGNKTIAHIYKGPIDVNSNNQLQRVTRLLQESNITFNDLLSTNMVFSKFTRDANISMPRGKNGEKLVEFETMEGQDIDLNTPFEEMLKKMAVLGTGVPSVLMEYVDQVDYAKQIDSANLRMAGRTSSLQSDLEDPCTKLYRILIANSTLDDSIKIRIVNSLKYKLPRPTVLVSTNNSEFMTNLTQLAETITNVILGPTAEEVIKTEFMNLFIRENAPFIKWERIDELVKMAKLNTEENKTTKGNSGDTSQSGNGDEF